VYADVHTDGDKVRDVRQVPHDRLIRSTFGGEGDVAQLLRFFAQMQMDEIRCVRLAAASMQGTELEDKTLTWGASGKRAWGQNVLTGAAAERRTVAMASQMVIIHPQAFLQPERAINVTPDTKAATARVLVTLHNDMRLVDRRDGFSLLNPDAPEMLIEDAAFHKFSEMSNIGPWFDKEDKLQWEHKMDAGYRGARNVRNGRLNRDAHIEKEGFMINDRGKEVITGFHKLGMLNRDAHIEKEGFMINDRGQEVITGFYELGKLGGAASRDALIAKGGYMINKHGKEVIACFHNTGALGLAAQGRDHAATALGDHHTHICISVLCQRGASVTWSKGTKKDYPVYAHLCYDFAHTGAQGQTPKQYKGMKHHMCKKCHRLAGHCAGGDGCRVSCNTPNHKSCQHLH